MEAAACRLVRPFTAIAAIMLFVNFPTSHNVCTVVKVDLIFFLTSCGNHTFYPN